MRQDEWADKLNALEKVLMLLSCFVGGAFLATFGAAWFFSYQPGYSVARVLAYTAATGGGAACAIDVLLVNPLYRRAGKLQKENK